ncbi:response regulator transcription factor [Leucobacter chromiireducens]|uniref:DNA-binding response regulator n=1 Tax=Leucobacter chromiireducens subsp. solipictus TaxID=398235 RepID=A0ABS1SBF3_9MICO|nr:response regulator transcription factor [Leucobacter chromiireducens]MBL3677874.1 DNA-binding response regulator [Leucobacter chromiireducens subsp. solipictus]
MRILIVEDDLRMSAALSAFLRKSGYSTHCVADGASALDAVNAETEAVLLDLGLPDLDGTEVCRRIRAVSGVPIIVATARGQIEERIRGLHAGADDFLVKPYDVRELLARLEAVTRRVRAAPEDWGAEPGVSVGGLHVDPLRRTVTIEGDPIDLTPKEFDILAMLVRYPGVAVPRDRMIREVWGSEWSGYSRALEVHVGSLRRKLGRDSVIATVRGVGYRFATAE